MAPLSNICKNIFIKCVVQRNGMYCRLVSTCGKKEAAAAASSDSTSCNNESASPESVYRKVPDFSKPFDNNKNWISYGFDDSDEGKDRYKLHMTYYAFISFFFCGFLFIHKYLPDKNRSDWAKREAFIRLHEREQLGLDPIDPNYIDPSTIILPPDEELSEEDIVI